MGGGGGQKMSVFVHAQGIKTVHAGEGGVKKRQNSVHVVVECPLIVYSNEEAYIKGIQSDFDIFSEI